MYDGKCDENFTKREREKEKNQLAARVFASRSRAKARPLPITTNRLRRRRDRSSRHTLLRSCCDYYSPPLYFPSPTLSFLIQRGRLSSTAKVTAHDASSLVSRRVLCIRVRARVCAYILYVSVRAPIGGACAERRSKTEQSRWKAATLEQSVAEKTVVSFVPSTPPFFFSIFSLPTADRSIRDERSERTDERRSRSARLDRESHTARGGPCRRRKIRVDHVTRSAKIGTAPPPCRPPPPPPPPLF